MKMKVYTISSGDVSEGTQVEKFHLSGADIDIPAILIGEKGRGRQLGVLPVQLLPEKHKKWQEDGVVTISAAEVGKTKSGNPKLFEKEEPDTEEKFVCVFRTKIGFRGGNSHTGDWTGESKPAPFGKEYIYEPFPGEIIVEGMIAQGEAGYMGCGDQIVAVIPQDTVFRTGYSGRLYGKPSEHYYIYRDGSLISVTWKERSVSDIF